MSALANLKMISTIFIGESLRFIVEGKTALARVQNLLHNISDTSTFQRNERNPFALGVFFKGRRYKPRPVRIESFRNDKPVLFSVRRLDDNSPKSQPQVILSRVSCCWSDKFDCPSLKDVTLKVTTGQLVGITGPVGSGKTSLLMAILGELPLSSGHLSCIGKIAYLSQVPWVFSGTIRENILFGKDFEEKTYNAIIRVCDLKIDLDSFPKGDLTEVGQRGVILSGGQRVRISLARMIYSDADIYLLDDPLSAVDAKVGKHLFDRCIKEFLAGRIRILVTHHLQFLKQTDYVVVLENGIVAQECKCIEMQIQKKGVFSGTTQERGTCTEWDSLEKSLGTFEGSSDKPVAVERKDKRIDLNDAEEDRVVGSVKWWRYWRYFRAALPVEMLVGLFAFFVIVQGKW